MRVSPPSELIRFGVFEVDLHTQELRKQGIKIKLNGQPFEVLAMLLSRPGELVTREEFEKRLWSGDTFVDFEHGLNAAVKKLREALGDDANNPRFVETLQRRGYRFIAPVEALTPGPSPGGRVDIESDLQPSPAGRGWPRAAGAGEGPLRKYWVVAAGGAVVAITIMLAAFNVAGLRDRLLHHGSQASSRSLMVTPLTSFPGVESGATFSPDGSQIAFHWTGEHRDNWDIYVKVIGSEKPLRLTTNPADDWWPAWSPDGIQIAFLRKMETNWAIFTIPPVGGAERRLIDLEWKGNYGQQAPGRLSWSPDGKWLAVSHKASEQKPVRILLLSLETLETRTLTSPPEQSNGDTRLAFSPDGKNVAIARSEEGGWATLMIQSVSGGVPRPVTSEGEPRFSVQGLAWTSDGKELLFSGSRAESGAGSWQPKYSLWRVSVSGGKPEQVAAVGDNVYSPATSRQGSLALMRQMPGVSAGIWRLPGPRSTSPGKSPQPFVVSTGGNFGPDFSLDGTKIAFTSPRATGAYGDIWVCDSDGSNLIRLTKLPAHAGTPRWSPDGKQIVFDSYVGGQNEVFLVNVEGGVPRQMTHQPSDDAIASWSRDGKWIYFSSNRTGQYQIWKMPVQGGRAIQVTRVGGIGAFESLDGMDLYFSKWGGGGPNAPGDGIWKVPVGGGDETRVLDRKVNCFNWKVTSEGIYFLSYTRFPGGEQWSIELLERETGKVTQLLSQTGSATHPEGLAVSPDGQWILYAEEPAPEGDIILVENFR